MKKKNSKNIKENLAQSLLVVAVLICVPLVGVFLVHKKKLKWSANAKGVGTIFAVLYIPIHTTFIIWLFLFGGIYYIGPHNSQALSYLRDRYHEEFVIGDSTGSDQLGGSKNYSKWVTPKNNPSLRFRIDRCLGNCSTYESTNFRDTYPQRKWSKQLTEQFTRKFIKSDGHSIYVVASTDSVNVIVDNHSGRDFDFNRLTSEEKSMIKLSASYMEEDGVYSFGTRKDHAKTILKIAESMQNSGAQASSIAYDIRASTPASEPRINSKDTFHFISDNIKALRSVDDIYPLFVVHTYGRGVIKDGYEARQYQINISNGQSYGANVRFDKNLTRQQAKKELEIADSIRDAIASDYLVSPYVVVNISPNDNIQPNQVDFSRIKPTDYRAEVLIYNYPNATISITKNEHKTHVATLISLLKKEFNSSSLVYRSDFPVCTVSLIERNFNSRYTCF